MRVPEIVILGRPNAGKSTLFNRLIRRRDAVMHSQPGVTRDRKTARYALDADRTARLVDTGGLFPEFEDAFSAKIERQARIALDAADLALFVVDASAISGLDHELAALIRKSNTPVILVANKIDRLRAASLPGDVYELGFAEIAAVSAEHGLQCDELRAHIAELLGGHEESDQSAEQADISFALIGRPNVGKSSLMNALLARERAITSPVAGTTRDSIDDYFSYNDIVFRAIDTAGLRHKARVRDDLEFYSTVRAHRSIEEADVNVLLIEEENLLTDQDKKIIDAVAEAGRGLVFALSKWDLAENKSSKRIAEIKEKIRFQLPELSWVPLCTTSARNAHGLKNLLDTVITVAAGLDKSIETAELNRFVEHELRTKAPSKRGRQLKIYYAVQTGKKPPAFTFFVNNALLSTPQYIQYIRNTLRKIYAFTGVPLAVTLRDKKE
ncbi:MAG: ribosome biogenesis GTPase Der [Spirochaetota bacterium]|jgi:GTP-binding protein|nr:ribosome biogenesis GTPase Der [Spirochaetota bacterium]